MKRFYLELANIKENQLNMAKVGYISLIRELGSKLISCTVKESYEISKQLAEAVEALRHLEDEYARHVKEYQEEALKGTSEKAEKENAL